MNLFSYRGFKENPKAFQFLWILHGKPALHPSADSAMVISFMCPGRWAVSRHRAQHTDVIQPHRRALFVVQHKVLAFIPSWPCCSKPGLRPSWHAQLSVTSLESLHVVQLHFTVLSDVWTTMSKGCFSPQQRKQLEILHVLLKSASLFTEVPLCLIWVLKKLRP